MGIMVHFLIFFIKIFAPKAFCSKLDKLEKNSTFNNILGLTLFNAVGGLIVMITNIKIANMLGASIFGIYTYYLAVGEVGQNFVRYGRNKTMTRDLVQCPEKFENLISNTFVLGFLNIILFIIVLLLFHGALDLDVSVLTFMLILAPCLHSVDFQPVYESMKQMGWHSLYVLLQKVIYLLAILVAVFTFDGLNIYYLGVALFFSWFIVDLMQFKEIIGQFSIKIRKNVSFSSVCGLYKDNFIIALSCMTGVAFGPLIRIILKNSADTQTVGIYSAGLQIFMISQFLMNQISRVGNPMMAEAGKKDCSLQKRRQFCKKYCLLMLLSVTPFALPLCLCPQFVTEICFTSEYAELASYLPYFGIYLYSFSIGVVFTQFLISMRRDKVYFGIYISSALCIVLCAFCLIPSCSVHGAVIALAIPNSVGCIMYFVFSLKYLKNDNSLMQNCNR